MQLTSVALVSAVLCALAIPTLVPLAKRLGLLDYPDCARKHHDGVIPLVGGPALGLTIIAMLPWWSNDASLGWPLAAAIASVAVALGALDDRFGLSVRTRLLTQLVLSLCVVYGGGVMITHLGDLTGSGSAIVLGWGVGSVVTVLALTAAMNAFNMLDGLDGHAACHAFIPLCCVLVTAAVGGAAVPSVAVTLVAAIPVFLCFNLGARRRRWPKVFLGDSGSLMLGALVGAVLVTSAARPRGWVEPVSVLWFVAIPLFDTLFVMSYRLIEGRSPLAADRHHIHHLLLDHGLSRHGVLAVSAGAGIALAVAGVVQELLAVPAWVRFGVLVLLFTGYVGFALRLQRLRPWLRPWSAASDSPESVGASVLSGTEAPLPKVSAPAVPPDTAARGGAKARITSSARR